MPNIFWLNVNKASGISADGNEQLITIEDQKGFIKSIRDATEKNITSSTKPRSIPHPWAKAYLTCEYVLMNAREEYNKLSETKQQLYLRIVGAWRGFLAMLALREVYDLDVQFNMLKTCDGIGESIFTNRPLVPKKEKLSPDMAETHPEFLIYVNGETVGVTYPSIMALPGYCPQGLSNHPWAKEDEFVDPIQSLTRGERLIVYAWVKHALDFYQRDKNKPYILNALKDYLNDLGLSKADLKLGDLAAQTYQGAHTIDKTFYAPLGESISLNRSEDSEIRIDGSDFLVINLADNIHPMQEKLVIGLLDELMYQRSPQLFKLFSPKNSKAKAINSGEIFLDKSYYFEPKVIDTPGIEMKSSTDAINPLHKSGNPQMLNLFPMKAEMAAILTPYFEKHPKLDTSGGSLNAVCTFSINGELKEFGRTYTREQRVALQSERLGSTVIWPNIDQCSQYIVASIANSLTGKRDGILFIPIGHDVGNAEKNRYRYNINHYPEYLKGVWNSVDSSGTIDIGIVKMVEPMPTPSGNLSANYALDFGTSATIAAYNLGSSIDSKKVDFSTQVYLIAADGDEAKNANRLLFGRYQIAAPYPTIYHAHPGPTKTMFEGGHPYFQVPNEVINITSDLKTNIKFDLGNGAGSAEIQQDYIRGLVHMLLIHARQSGVSSVDLKISYPISIEDVKAFKNNIKEIASEYNKSQNSFDKAQTKKSIDYPYSVELNEKTLTFISESEAATRYFFVPHEKQESITLDIGGGSADLFAYNGTGKGKAMTASVVAGSRIFLLYLLYKHPDIIVDAMDVIKGKLHNESISKRLFDPSIYLNQQTAEAFYTELELLFQYDYCSRDGAIINMGREIAKVVRNGEGSLGTGELKNKLKKMKTIWLVQLAAFFFYGGLMYKKTTRMLNQESINKLNVFLAGRGSQVIDWLPLGNTEEVLKLMIISALDIDIKSIGISLKRDINNCKMEAAVGMLKPSLSFDDTELAESEFVFDYIIGEDYIDKKGEKHPALDLFKHKNSISTWEEESRVIKEDYECAEESLPELTRFFDALNGLIESSKLCDAVFRIKLCETANQAQQLNRQNDNAFYIDKRSLVDSVENFISRIKQGKSSVDIPIFFHLINFIRDQAVDKWL